MSAGLSRRQGSSTDVGRVAGGAVHPQASPVYWFAKRALDIVVSLVTLIVLGVPMLLIAILIKIDDPDGPVFFRQQRTGLGGRRFFLLKYRTMVSNAEELKEQLRDQSEVPWPDFRLKNDPRVTKIGKFLRKTSLDEMPQFLNVLKGEMTLVGPRPTSFEAGTYDLWQTGRLDFRPGITGPWQIKGRSSMDFEERCRLEISYFRHPSMIRDIGMIFATIRAVFRGTGVA